MRKPKVLQRHPYQDPQTSMERHVAKLLEFLRASKGSTWHFAREIEDAQAHAFYLEQTVQRLLAENRELEDMLAFRSTRTVVASYSERDAPVAMRMLRTVDFVVESMHWRGEFPELPDERTWRRIRRSTYRQILQLLRRQFDERFPARPSR